jgi:general secretion pathway protein E
MALGVDPGNPPTLYHAGGCADCNQLGYRGRTGIYELVELDDEMRARIHDGDSEQKLEAYARQRSPGMRQDGWRRALAGETTVEEVLRVTQEG